MNKKEVRTALQCLLEDLRLLQGGRWTPDESSCEASIGNVYRVAKEVGVELTEPVFNEDLDDGDHD